MTTLFTHGRTAWQQHQPTCQTAPQALPHHPGTHPHDQGHVSQPERGCGCLPQCSRCSFLSLSLMNLWPRMMQPWHVLSKNTVMHLSALLLCPHLSSETVAGHAAFAYTGVHDHNNVTQQPAGVTTNPGGEDGRNRVHQGLPLQGSGTLAHCKACVCAHFTPMSGRQGPLYRANLRGCTCVRHCQVAGAAQVLTSVGNKCCCFFRRRPLHLPGQMPGPVHTLQLGGQAAAVHRPALDPVGISRTEHTLDPVPETCSASGGREPAWLHVTCNDLYPPSLPQPWPAEGVDQQTAVPHVRTLPPCKARGPGSLSLAAHPARPLLSKTHLLGTPHKCQVLSVRCRMQQPDCMLRCCIIPLSTRHAGHLTHACICCRQCNLPAAPGWLTNSSCCMQCMYRHHSDCHHSQTLALRSTDRGQGWAGRHPTGCTHVKCKSGMHTLQGCAAQSAQAAGPGAVCTAADTVS